MVPHVKFTYRAGQWWWELKAHDERLMTPDRFVDEGNQDTYRGALAEAAFIWAEHARMWL